jgi:hypothetical protein
VVLAGDDCDLFVRHLIDEAVFVRDAARPVAL